MSLIALGWILGGARSWRGMARIPRLTQVPPATGENLPRVSILYAARDEAEKLPAALSSLLSLDYPNYEVIAVNDRSGDATPRILEEFARVHPRLKVVHVSELPAGWLGKPHGLQAAYEQSSGEWLVFTDADVLFAPDLLSRAMRQALDCNLDHLTLLAAVDLHGFWETATVTYLGLIFVFGNQPWRVSNPNATSYMGVGAFQMIRRSAYQAIGTHRRLALEVVDDMKLGKLVKKNGFRSGLAAPEELLRVRWQDGCMNLIRGLTKNLFAGLGYNARIALVGVTGIFLISILPFLALFFATGVVRLAAAAAVACAVAFEAVMVQQIRKSPLYGLTHPLGALIFIYMILRSTCVTLWQGGVSWRGTFYPLEELRKGVV